MNKRERLKTVLAGGIPDLVPAGFWFHYSSDYTVDEMADAHLKLYRETDMDIIKVMQDYPYAISGEVKEPGDWYKIKAAGRDCDEFRKMEAVLRRICEQAGDEVMIFQTMFGPFKAASMKFGDEVLMRHCRENPEAVLAGIQIIADALEDWAAGYLDAGADGIYYSAQFAEVGRFTETEWKTLVMPSDLQILQAAEKRDDKYNILHICGEPEYDFQTYVEWFGEYPADLYNWSVKDNHYHLQRGKDFFKKPILGGLNNKGNILNGTEAAIREEVRTVLQEIGRAGFMVGADCTIQGENISLEKIRIAVDEAHKHVNG